MKQTTAKTTGPFRATLLLVALSLCFASCSYSVIIVSKKGSPDPEPTNNVAGFYALKKVRTLDSVAKLSVAANEVHVNLGERRFPPGLHSVEYRVTFGDLLRNTFTFGKRRGIKIKYVYFEETNN